MGKEEEDNDDGPWQADMEWKDNYDLRRRYIPFYVFWLYVVGGTDWLRGKVVDLLVFLKGLRLP